MSPFPIAALVRGLAVAILLAATAVHAQPVELFSPQGEVKGVRQVTARFAQPMVRVRRSARTRSVRDRLRGKGHRSLGGHEELGLRLRAGPAGRRALRVHGEARDRRTRPGQPVAAGERFEFSTGGPAILRSLPYEGSRIDENQVFILGLDAPVKPETIAAHARCVATGVNEEIGVRLVTGGGAQDDPRQPQVVRGVLPARAVHGQRRGPHARLPVPAADDRQRPGQVPAVCAMRPIRRSSRSRARARCPQGADVKLVWGKGIAATTGVATSAAQALAFKVRPAFRASFTCERVNKDAQCIPILPLSLSFTAPDRESRRAEDPAGRRGRQGVAGEAAEVDGDRRPRPA